MIPRCDGKTNCTLTVRIPRFYLSAEEREQVCRTRYIYGTDVYADDSDPLCAAIHSGWICGAWGDDFVLETLGVDLDVTVSKKDQTTMLLHAPKIPMVPLAGMDLHVTLLILPQLQRYMGTMRHGIKSREWGGDHDGMSFRIEKVRWVDTSSDRSEERTAVARRRRLQDNSMGSRGKGPGLRLGLWRQLGGKVENGRIGVVAA